MQEMPVEESQAAMEAILCAATVSFTMISTGMDFSVCSVLMRSTEISQIGSQGKKHHEKQRTECQGRSNKILHMCNCCTRRMRENRANIMLKKSQLKLYRINDTKSQFKTLRNQGSI